MTRVLNYLGPELVKAGHLKNEPWIEQVAKEAEFSVTFLDNNDYVRTAAVLIAVCDVNGIDYLRQAPILAATLGYSTRFNMLRVAGRDAFFRSRGVKAIRDHKKLRVVMDHFHAPYPLRKLSANAMSFSVPPMKMLTALNAALDASTLAQLIPTSHEAQRTWVYDLSQWYDYSIRLSDPGRHLGWAARVLALRGTNDSPYLATNIADYVFAHLPIFNERWTMLSVHERMGAWHRELAARGIDDARRVAGPGFEKETDPAPLPEQYLYAGMNFVALKSPAALYLEGKAMAHCVYTYADKVRQGKSTIYSIRIGQQCAATLEVGRKRYARPGGIFEYKYALQQIQGHRNTMVDQKLRKAVTAVIEHWNVRYRFEAHVPKQLNLLPDPEAPKPFWE